MGEKDGRTVLKLVEQKSCNYSRANRNRAEAVPAAP
jgi:hypothetical protein